MQRRLVAEFLGTFALVFAGTGAIVFNDLSAGEFSEGVIGHIGIAATFGLIVMAMIHTFGDISGAHLNPAVTLAFAFSKRFEGKAVLGYLMAQCLGAIAASASLVFLAPWSTNLGATVPIYDFGLRTFVLETYLTFLLMTVILHVSTGAKEKGITAGIAIGGTVGLMALFAGPYTGASMNPARSLGPALMEALAGQPGPMALQKLWIYLLAPTLGALGAVLLCRFLRTEGCCGDTDCGPTAPAPDEDERRD